MGKNNSSVKRLAIIPADLGKLSIPAFEYLVLKLNTLQEDIEFVFLPLDNTLPFLESLSPSNNILVNDFKKNALEFINWLEINIGELSTDYGLKTNLPDKYLIVSLSSLDTHWYSIFEEKYSAVFFGDWENVMAPPSLLEFIITMIITEGLELMILKDAWQITHLDTRGCIGDFNCTLKDVRYKTLQGFLCNDCRNILEKSIGQEKTKKWVSVLSKDWIGHTSDQTSPASIVAKLGYDLFITKGISPTLWQKFILTLREEGIKELIKIVGAIIVAALLLWLNLKK